jgi:hypothetical protein
VQKLKKSGVHGAFIYPKRQNNIPSDLYGLFSTSTGSYVLLRIQVKDWFQDKSKKYVDKDKIKYKTNDIVETWRKHDDYCPRMIELEDNTTVPVISLLFCTNKIQQKIEVGPNEGVITINDMCQWLPFAAHAMQTAAHLREIFSIQEDNSE